MKRNVWTFVCHFFVGSDVKWYKGTSEWQIKPSKFFKPKSDGTKHQLFILEAYAEDEGQSDLFRSDDMYLLVFRTLQMCCVESSGNNRYDCDIESRSYVYLIG